MPFRPRRAVICHLFLPLVHKSLLLTKMLDFKLLSMITDLSFPKIYRYPINIVSKDKVKGGFVIGTADGEFNPYWNFDNKHCEYMVGDANRNPAI